MNFKTFAITAAGLLFATSTAQKMTNNLNYPQTKKIDHFDEYFGEKVNDPYRWLEDDRAEAVSYTHLDVYKRQAINIPTK